MEDSISDNQKLVDDFAHEYRKEHEQTVSEWRAENPAVNRYFDLYRAARLQITMGTIAISWSVSLLPAESATIQRRPFTSRHSTIPLWLLSPSLSTGL